jgi:hypothetical protein
MEKNNDKQLPTQNSNLGTSASNTEAWAQNNTVQNNNLEIENSTQSNVEQNNNAQTSTKNNDKHL